MRYLITILFISFSLFANTQIVPRRSSPATGVAPPFVRDNLIFSNGGEQVDAASNTSGGFNYYESIEEHEPHNVTRDNAHAREGSWAMKIDVRVTDNVQGDRCRGECVQDFAPADIFERWYGISYWLDATAYASPDPQPENILQWHTEPNPTFPISPFGIYIVNNNFYVNRCINGNDGFGNPWVCTATTIGPITAGVWIDFVLHIKWTDAADGFIRIWKDAASDAVTPWFSYNGATNYANLSNYFKCGYNKWPWPPQGSSPVGQKVMWIDAVRIGTSLATFDDVKPGP